MKGSAFYPFAQGAQKDVKRIIKFLVSKKFLLRAVITLIIGGALAAFCLLSASSAKAQNLVQPTLIDHLDVSCGQITTVNADKAVADVWYHAEYMLDLKDEQKEVLCQLDELEGKQFTELQRNVLEARFFAIEDLVSEERALIVATCEKLNSLWVPSSENSRAMQQFMGIQLLLDVKHHFKINKELF